MTPLLLLTLAAADAPITQVTVFTDQARVVRTATTSVSGTASFEFPPLGDLVDMNSVRVEATGAEVRRVDIERLEPEKLRTDEARAVIADLDKLDQQIAQQGEELAVIVAQRDALSRLSPQAPANDPLKAPARLNASGWATSASFIADQLGKLQARGREGELQLKKLDEKRQVLLEKARTLGYPQTRSGWKVVAQLGGNGPATLTMTYLVRQAQWTPTWDLQLQPETNTVNLSLAALVTQSTQEDWQNVALQLSTAIPSSASRAPKLSTWKIGVADRFIPTASPMYEVIAPPPPVPGETRARTEEDFVRGELAQLVGQAQPEERAKNTSDKRKTPRREPPSPPPSVAPTPMARNGVNAPAAPPAAQSRSYSGSIAVANKSYEFDDATVEGDLVRPESATVEIAGLASGVAVGSIGGKASVATASYSLSPPPSWRPPNFGPDSPVTLANGYDLAFAALQKESVPSAAGARRIALWSSKWPVTVERKLYPALTTDAFLVAELKNPSQQVLPGGPAQLYVGADPAGTARLKLVSPGESFTLPLGIDRALKPVRNVQLVEATTGVISKDEVGTYTVTIELANPYKAPVAVRVFDQLPVTELKELESKLIDSKPTATVDAKKGSLEWRATIGAGQKSIFTFTYTLKRPRGWKLNQSEVAP